METDRQMDYQRIRALRGATTCSADERAAILEATDELLRELLTRNLADPEGLISMVFTATPDLSAAFPAEAARAAGMADIPLLCAQEMDVPGAPDRCIRVLVHLYLPSGAPLRHVYLHGAKDLRADLDE